jgi:hypothetical protein
LLRRAPAGALRGRLHSSTAVQLQYRTVDPIKFVYTRYDDAPLTGLSPPAPGPLDSSQQTTLGLQCSLFAPTHPISRKAPSKSAFLTWTDRARQSLLVLQFSIDKHGTAGKRTTERTHTISTPARAVNRSVSNTRRLRSSDCDDRMRGKDRDKCAFFGAEKKKAPL